MGYVLVSRQNKRNCNLELAPNGFQELAEKFYFIAIYFLYFLCWMRRSSAAGRVAFLTRFTSRECASMVESLPRPLRSPTSATLRSHSTTTTSAQHLLLRGKQRPGHLPRAPSGGARVLPPVRVVRHLSTTTNAAQAGTKIKSIKSKKTRRKMEEENQRAQEDEVAVLESIYADDLKRLGAKEFQVPALIILFSLFFSFLIPI